MKTLGDGLYIPNSAKPVRHIANRNSPLIIQLAAKIGVHPVDIFCNAMMHLGIDMSILDMRLQFNRCSENCNRFPDNVNDFCLDVLAGRINPKTVELLSEDSRGFKIEWQN